jgi:uncharacterized zinc-type alcohol dehydrogenase-like protein
VPVGALISGAKSVTGSPTGSPAALRQLLKFAARKNIAPQIELYPMSKLNDAIERLHSGHALSYRVKSRFLNQLFCRQVLIRLA